MGWNYLSTGAGFLASTVAPENWWLEDDPFLLGISAWFRCFCCYPTNKKESIENLHQLRIGCQRMQQKLNHEKLSIKSGCHERGVPVVQHLFKFELSIFFGTKWLAYLGTDNSINSWLIPIGSMYMILMVNVDKCTSRPMDPIIYGN